ncbi:EmrB/QacA subfamily drug resistance transporter [Catenulispora sp. GP43]|uniref:MDR family MFS transporter n=1 Tax=Catenulispora sp. GP43 TaxID=3156263 RepID=UPI0035144908
MSTTPAPPHPDAAPRHVRWALLGVMLAMLLSMLDNTVVGTSMPTIVRELGGFDHLSWVVVAYTLATAASTPVWGKLGDLYGRKHVYLASIVLFLAGSALSGAAQSMSWLIAARAFQGIGAGGIGAGAFALIAALVPPRERGRYQGMTASVMAIGTIGGPLLGGFVTGHFGWRWAFYLNLPLGLLALVWCQVMLDLPVVRRRARIDWAGISLLTLVITSVTLAANWAGTTYSWASWQVIGLFALAAAGVGAFIAIERRCPEPVLPPRVFTGQRNFPLAIALITASGVVMFGASLYLPLFQQSVQHATATSSGLLLLPMMIPIVIVSQLGGRYMSATGRYKIFPVLGAALMAVGLILLSTMDPSTSRTATSLYMAIVGVGLGAQMQMVTTIAQNSVEMRDMGAASASLNLFRTVGGSIGVAVFGSLYNRQVSHEASAVQGVANGSHLIFLITGLVCAVAFTAALAIKEVPLRKATGPGVTPAGSPALADRGAR